MASGEKIVAGSPLHEVFHRHSQEAQRLLAAINTGYHEAREVRAVLGRLWECELDETVTVWPPFFGSSSECENAISCPLFMTGCKEMKTGCKHANDRPFGPLGGPGAVFTCSHPCTSPVWRVSRDRAA